MKRLTNKFKMSCRRGERGFTLVELLIVIAIIGILAAVVIPNVGRFTKSGSIAAAKAEKQELQVAVDAMFAEAGVSSCAGFNAWDGTTGTVTVVMGGVTYDAGDYIMRTPVKGLYDVAATGLVTCDSYPGLAPGDMGAGEPQN